MKGKDQVRTKSKEGEADKRKKKREKREKGEKSCLSVVMEGEGEEGDVALVKGQSRRRLWSFFAVHNVNVLVSRRLFIF